MLSTMRFDAHTSHVAAEVTQDAGPDHVFLRATVPSKTGGRTLVAYAVSRGDQSERDADFALFCDLVALNRR